MIGKGLFQLFLLVLVSLIFVNGQLVQTFTGHTSYIESVFVDNGFLYSGSVDTTIKQWNVSSGENTHNFTGHTSAVLSVSVADGFLYSGSDDDTIKQWNKEYAHLHWSCECCEFSVCFKWLFVQWLV